MGGGIDGVVDGHHVIVGSPAFVRARIAGDSDGHPRPGYTVVVVAVDGTIVAHASIGDLVRDDVASSIETLRRLGWTVRILSGDSTSAVQAAGAIAGVEASACIGDASPEDKLAVVERLATSGPVIMVGDGVNDASAIAAASVGVGVHGGAEACLAVADVYLTKPGLAPLVQLVHGSTRTMAVIRRNMMFSIVYNSIGAWLAMSGVLTPLLAAILMPASSLTVVLASWRSHTFDQPG
jgi:Cu2+-exporting ATPase